MPKDLWLRARINDVMKQARRDFAEDPDHGTFPYSWSDDPVPDMSKRQIKKIKLKQPTVVARTKLRAASNRPRYVPSLQEARKQIFLSRKVWASAGCLLPEAFAITGMQAVVRPLNSGRWAWCVESGTSIESGEAATLEDARISALEAVSKKHECLKRLAAFVGIALPAAKATDCTPRSSATIIVAPKAVPSPALIACPECGSPVKPENLDRHTRKIHRGETTKFSAKPRGKIPELVLQRR